MEEKLDKIVEELVAIRKDLDYHIKRTNLLEERTEVLVWMRLTANFLKWAAPVAAAVIAYLVLKGN